MIKKIIRRAYGGRITASPTARIEVIRLMAEVRQRKTN
jgi:hypothetical protein